MYMCIHMYIYAHTYMLYTLPEKKNRFYHFRSCFKNEANGAREITQPVLAAQAQEPGFKFSTHILKAWEFMPVIQAGTGRSLGLCGQPVKPNW